ncbi:carboxylate--amine ligase [Levilactobacillus zymae]|uniref:Carboxylate--amine ligase n=1 Tax=Levilactobacillus zymae TaxID=267363 RepID=A0ABQ0WYC0_9LACO|nr:carboxylate--amine ligase [Levilactobacillus zymae]KRL16565.1 ATP-grasp protein [Levilactobacillus zymae DSM 19395]QFR60974.1 carboxylate--amine ligase [Levilactobacillus zymae]GEO72643.1 carboxylate--amine ligase [Levilactobacillus zymae]
METKNGVKFTPVLLGSDFNVYGMARSFYDLYHQPVQAFASIQLAPTRYTKVVNLELIPGFDEDPVWIETMRKLKERYANHPEPVILIGCGDGYAELISKHKAELEDVFICPYVDYDQLRQLNNKENFYKVCDQYGLPYPHTKIITKAEATSGEPIDQPFGYPVALKPANSVEWLDVHFEGRKKAFRIQSAAEFKDIVGKIYTNGYTSDLILQDFIPGDDSNMRVLNAYVDQDHHVKMMCLGHPLLEDCAPSAIGNYVAIIPEYNETIYQDIQKFLEAINFTGYANFDMKYDSRDQSFKLFEINLRQGRSSFFVTLNGYNLADWVVKDYVTHSLTDAPTVYGNQDADHHALWLGVPVKVFKQYTRENADKERALKLIAAGQYGTTYRYDQDMNLKRWALIKWMEHNYTVNFKKYFAENKG